MTGWIVGVTIATIVLLVGIYGSLRSRRRKLKNKWAGWFVLFGICAWISAFINYPFR